jgi:polar amino acid transport system ATP-binding protein
MEFARNISNRVFYMDEGLIYEEGPPEQIFENPQKDKTRAFIHRIRSYNYHISSRNYDLYKMQAEMETFCDKHVLPPKVKGHILHIAEEVLGLQKDFFDIDMNLYYSEKDGTMEMVCESTGDLFNPLEEGALDDNLGLLLIRARSKSTVHNYEKGRNILALKMKGE